ncbi:hypothetical protein, partial [Streptomyces sp. NPDC055080]
VSPAGHTPPAGSSPRVLALSELYPVDVLDFTSAWRHQFCRLRPAGFAAGEILLSHSFRPVLVIPRAVLPLREFLDTCRIKEGSE